MGFFKELGKGLLNAVSGGLTGAVGSLFGLGSEAASNAMSLKDSKELMKYQFDLQQQGIDKQNQYNSPVEQMKRLEAAGLNPHLVYGNGSVVGNTSSAASASLGKTRQTELTKYAEMAQSQSLAQAQSEIENNKKYGNLLDSKVNETNQSIKESQARVKNLNADTQVKDNSDIWFNTSLALRRQLLENEVALKSGQFEVAIATAKRLNYMTNKQGELIDAQINQIGQTIAQKWRSLELEGRRLEGQLKLWASQGSFYEKQGKAMMISAMTGRMIYDLQKAKWDELAPLIIDNMRQKNFGQWLKNKWTEVKNQWSMENDVYDQSLKQSQINLNLLKYEDMLQDTFNDFLDF